MPVEEIQSSGTPSAVAGAQFMLNAQRGRYEPATSLNRFSQLGEACSFSPRTGEVAPIAMQRLKAAISAAQQ
jgi:hypothetical protein